MNPDATKRIWKFSKHKLTDKLLLLALAEYADGDSVCFPGYETLGEAVGVNRRSAIRIVEKLTESGEVFYKPTVGRGNTNLYFVVVGLSTGEVRRILKDRFEMPEEEAEFVADSLLRKGVIYDINGVTGSTISSKKGVTGDVKGVMGNTRIEDVLHDKALPTFEILYNRWLDNNLGELKPRQVEMFGDYYDEHPDWVSEIMDKTIGGKPTNPWQYFIKIINSWVKGGRPVELPETPRQNSPPAPTIVRNGKAPPIDKGRLEQLKQEQEALKGVT